MNWNKTFIETAPQLNRIYHPYHLWEDFINGMWRKAPADEEKELLQIAIEFTGNHVLYGIAMLKVITQWGKTCEHNLTDNAINKKAFIGHCAVCLELGIPEYITRSAWGYLTQEQQDLANLEADKAIKEWEQKQFKTKQTKLF